MPTTTTARLVKPLSLILSLALVLGMVLGGVLGAGVLSPSAAWAVDLESAQADLDMLKKSKKSRAINDDLFQYLDQVFAAYEKPDRPEKPADDAYDEEKKAYATAKANSDKKIAQYRKSAQKVILSIVTLFKVVRETNTRDDVNTRAAVLLGDMAGLKNADGTPVLDKKARKDLSKKIMQAVDKKLTKVKSHDVNPDTLDAALAALGKLNDPSSLAWMLKNYTHANDNKKEYLIAAHKAMVLFTDVPGKLRQDICATMVKSYAGVESQAKQVSSDPKITAKKDFWDAIKTYTIPVMQYYAGKPEDEEGVPMAEMSQFQTFMRSHRSPKKAPWVDEKIKK